MVDDGTLPPSEDGAHLAREPGAVPGIVVVFARNAAACRVFALAAGAELELGRGKASEDKLDDGRVSRRHASVRQEDGTCVVTDLGSQNGTFVDGARIAADAPTVVHRVLRVGDTLLVPCRDVRPLERHKIRERGGFVRGPRMQAILDEVERAARPGGTLLVHGESGTGKEAVAQAFHAAVPARGAGRRPFIAVNCAAIPHALAERLLFGAKRGTFTDAHADAPGYVQEADGGTLFLDEIGELDSPCRRSCCACSRRAR